MFSPTPFPGWALEALTGNPEVDSKHRLLLNAMARLKEVCSKIEHRKDCRDCPSSQNTSCNHDLIDTMGDLLAFLVDHFFAEEQAMKKFGLTVTERQLCDRHKEDHAKISDTVLRIVSAIDKSQTVALIKQLDSVLQTWVKHHIELHDVALVRMLETGNDISKKQLKLGSNKII